jgi:signal transduction histidine kinase
LADGVITALSNFARLPVPSLQPFSVETCLRETIDSLQVPRDVAVSIKCPPSLPRALGDTGQLRIVFGNLFRNARDAMPHGGRLTISARRQEERIDISVTDTGDGIPRENLQHIMEPLFTTKARGIGLGLAMARAIVEKHNGQLAVESEPGRGATFTVSLPAAPEHPRSDIESTSQS